MEIATRDAYGKTLAELGEKNPRIVVLDADLSCSTKTQIFAQKFPERFFNMGVAEQDMMGTAAGLALAGKIPFASTFAVFATGRAWEVVRNSIAYPKLNVKICASHAGLTVGEDGASHQAIADVAVMRAIPNMTVLVPADGPETEAMIRKIVDHPGPVYVRLGRAKVPVIYEGGCDFSIGKGQVLREGKDFAIVATGLMVAYALQVAKNLSKQGIEATVVNMSTIKPIDEALLKQLAQKFPLLVTVEEHSIIGGLGSAVAETLSEVQPVKIKRIGVRDQFGQSGTYQDVLHYYQLDPEGIEKQILGVIPG